MHQRKSVKSSKANRKKVVKLRDDGEEIRIKQDQKHPIICLPEIVDAPIQRCWRRFVASAAVSGSVTIADLLNQFMVAYTTTSGSCYVRALRIKAIRLLCPVTSQGTSISCQIQPNTTDGTNNSFSAVPENFRDTSASIDVPAYLYLKPSIDTPLGAWHYSTAVSTNLFLLIAPSGSTMDIQFEYILGNQSVITTFTQTIAAATPGTLFSRAILTNFTPLVFTVY
jgi:hypothetical protein